MLNKFGTGTLTLTNSNTHSGTAVSSGLLLITHAGALGNTGNATASASGTIGLQNNISVARPFLISGNGYTSQGAINNVADTNVITGAITLSANASIGAADGTALTLSGLITDNGLTRSLTKVGQGTLVLNHSNSFTGGMIVAGGVLRVPLVNSLTSGTTTTVQSGASLELPGGVNVSRLLQINGTGFGGKGALYSVLNDTWSGGITLQSNAAVGADAGSTLTIGGGVTGAFSLVKVGPGRLVLTNTTPGASNFNNVVVNEGTFALSNPAVLPASSTLAVNGTGAEIELSGNTSVDRLVTLIGDGVSSSGALHNVSGNNTWAGMVNIPLPTSIGADANSILQISGAIGGTGAITKTGAGVVILSGANSIGGPVTVAQGPLRLASNGALGAASSVNVLGGSALELTGNITAARPITLAGSGVVATGALRNLSGSNTYSGPITVSPDATIGVDAGSTLTITGVVSDGPGNVALIKVGAGTLALTSANVYDGGTLVNGGTLAANSNVALGNAGMPVTTNNGAKLLFTASTTTSRTFNLNTGSLQVDAGATLAYAGATVNGGFLRGPGTHSIGAASSLNGVTALPGTNLTVSAAFLTNFTNAGYVTNTGPIVWDGGFNSAAGNIVTSATLDLTAFENNGTITLNAGSGLVNSGNPLTSGGGSRITVASGASLNLTSTSLQLNGALLTNNGDVFGAVFVNYGATARGSGTYHGAVTVSDGGVFESGVPAPSALIVGSLDLVAPTAAADITTSLVIDYSGASTVEAVRSDIASAYHGGLWDRPGVGSSVAADPANGYIYALAYADNAAVRLGEFAGHSVDSSSLLLKLTFYGDANLNGVIDSDDFALLDRGLLNKGAFWWEGDFNYDAVVDERDYLLIDRTYGQTSGLSPTFLSMREAQFGSAYVSQLITAVPEPGLISAAYGLSAVLLQHRRARPVRR